MPKFVSLPCYSSCSQNLGVALDFAFEKKKDEELRPVIFVISCKNYYSPDGISLKDENCSSYPQEKEFLLREGCPVFVLEVIPDYEIKNSHLSFSEYNGRKVTIINLFHDLIDAVL